MDAPPPSPIPQRLRRIWRGVHWHRRKFAALCAAVAVFAALDVLRPAPPPTTPVVTARHDLPAGVNLRAEDLDVVAWPASRAPAHRADREDLIGRNLTSAIARGAPLTSLNVTGDAWSDLRPGHVAVSVHLQDSALAELLSPGQHVRLSAIDPHSPGTAQSVANDAVVLAIPRPDARANASQSGRLVVFDVPESESDLVVSSAVSRYLAVTWGG